MEFELDGYIYTEEQLLSELREEYDLILDEYDDNWWSITVPNMDEETFDEYFASSSQYYQEYENLKQTMKQDFENWFLTSYGFASWYEVPEFVIDIVEDFERRNFV